MRHVAMLRTLVLFIVFCCAAFAQRDLGTILGTVTDSQGGVVASAKVTITEDATGITNQVTTNSNGEYIRPLLKPGTYTVTAEATGFKTSVQKGVQITSGDRISVNMTLAVGEITQSVEITATAPVLQTESTDLGHDISAKQVSELPLGGQRNFAYLAHVTTNGANAEYGRGAGGVVDVTLKSGTNQLHGSVFEYLQNDAIDANRWENNKAGQPIGAFRQNQFGGTAGGPIIKNKLFIFGDYQGTRIASTGGAYPSLGTSGFFTIPTPAMRNGDFSGIVGKQVGTDALGRPIYQGEIYDPLSQRTVNGQLVRDPFQGN